VVVDLPWFLVGVLAAVAVGWLVVGARSAYAAAVTARFATEGVPSVPPRNANSVAAPPSTSASNPVHKRLCML